jgi:hypothetical protein
MKLLRAVMFALATVGTASVAVAQHDPPPVQALREVRAHGGFFDLSFGGFGSPASSNFSREGGTSGPSALDGQLTFSMVVGGLGELHPFFHLGGRVPLRFHRRTYSGNQALFAFVPSVDLMLAVPLGPLLVHGGVGVGGLLSTYEPQANVTDGQDKSFSWNWFFGARLQLARWFSTGFEVLSISTGTLEFLRKKNWATGLNKVRVSDLFGTTFSLFLSFHFSGA